MNKKFNNDVVIAKNIEVSLAECGGDFNKMLKKFSRKVKKEEILKGFYGKLAFFSSKSQKRRAKKSKGIYASKRKAEKNLDES